jgi:hypothetical protein
MIQVRLNIDIFHRETVAPFLIKTQVPDPPFYVAAINRISLNREKIPKFNLQVFTGNELI